MGSLSSILTLAHLLGLALGVGAATVKLGLLLRCGADHAFTQSFLRVSRPITGQIILGLVLLTLSGTGWLLLGSPITPRLVVKLALVGPIWVLGPYMDKVVEPRFRKLAPAPGESASPEFTRIRKRYILLEAIATALFYLIIAVWVVA